MRPTLLLCGGLSGESAEDSVMNFNFNTGTINMAQNRLAIYQIYYDAKTRAQRDPGFLPLDNTDNLRPDWFEYWPIRRFINSAILADDCYYGFFSPKFNEKTGLTSSQVIEFASTQDADIVSFSPYFDQSAFALNIFEQARANHQGIEECFDLLFDAFGMHGELENMVMTAEETIFCNFFVAKKHVWETWLLACEKVFAISEMGNSSLADALNRSAPYISENVGAKVFVIERMISLLISRHRMWKVKAYQPTALPMTSSLVSAYPQKLLLLNALKNIYCQNKEKKYIEQFFMQRSNIEDLIN